MRRRQAEAVLLDGQTYSFRWDFPALATLQAHLPGGLEGFEPANLWHLAAVLWALQTSDRLAREESRRQERLALALLQTQLPSGDARLAAVHEASGRVDEERPLTYLAFLALLPTSGQGLEELQKVVAWCVAGGGWEE